MSTAELPFRWDLSRREQLGTLVRGEPAARYPELVDDLRGCCARVLALAGDSTLVFVGRSPESIHDYLCGQLEGTGFRERLHLLNLSLRHGSVAEVTRSEPWAEAALRAQLRHLGLTPVEVASAPRPVAFVDLVSSGTTFGELQGLLCALAEADGVDVRAVRRRIRFVGITARYERPGPRGWRWSREPPWTTDYRPGALKSVAVPWRLWDYLGNWQRKVARWNPPHVWSREEARRPPREPGHLEALRLALELYRLGEDGPERERFAAELAARPEMRGRWLRRLVTELRFPPGAPRGTPRLTAGGRRHLRRRSFFSGSEETPYDCGSASMGGSSTRSPTSMPCRSKKPRLTSRAARYSTPAG